MRAERPDGPSIADHGLVGDLRTAALVATDGTIDWFCPGRFDAPSVFASILDPDAGSWRLGPDDEEARSRNFPRSLHNAAEMFTALGHTSSATRLHSCVTQNASHAQCCPLYSRLYCV